MGWVCVKMSRWLGAVCGGGVVFTPTNVGVPVRFSGILLATRADAFVYDAASVLNPVFEWK